MAIREKTFMYDGKVMLYRRGNEGGDYLPNNWYVKIKLPKVPAIRVSLGTTNQDEARALATEAYLEKRFRLSKGLSLKSTQFRQVATDYLADLNLQSAMWEKLPRKDRGNLRWASSNKLKNQSCIIQKYLLQFFDGFNLEDITKKQIEEYVRYRQSYWISGQGSKTQEIVYERNGRKVSRPKRPSEHSAPTYGTINKELTVIRQIFAYACEKDLVSQTEIPAIKNLSKPKNYDEDHERPSFTEHELDTVFRTVADKWVGQGNSKHKLAHMRLLYYMMLLALTGMRVTEAKNLKFSAFQTYQHNGEEQLKVLVGGKGKQRLITPLDGCAELIRKWKNHHKKNAEMHGWTFSDDIHVLTNEHGRRIKSHDTALNHLLEECNLLHDPQGRKRNAGSFRSQYITAALTNSNLTHYQIAVNCGTSVEVIERHYSRMQSIHIPEKFKFRSIVNEYF